MLERLAANNEHFDVLSQPEGDIALLAAGLMNQPLAVIGPTELQPALNRFKNQMNENAARFVRAGTLPEMNHNESVAWGWSRARCRPSGCESSRAAPHVARHAPEGSATPRLDGCSRHDRNGMEPRGRRTVLAGMLALPLHGDGLALDHAGVPSRKRPRCDRTHQCAEESPQLGSVERTADQPWIGVLLQGLQTVSGRTTPGRSPSRGASHDSWTCVRRPSTVFIFVAQCRQHGAPVERVPGFQCDMLARLRWPYSTQKVRSSVPRGHQRMLEGEGCVS